MSWIQFSLNLDVCSFQFLQKLWWNCEEIASGQSNDLLLCSEWSSHDNLFFCEIWISIHFFIIFFSFYFYVFFFFFKPIIQSCVRELCSNSKSCGQTKHLDPSLVDKNQPCRLSCRNQWYVQQMAKSKRKNKLTIFFFFFRAYADQCNSSLCTCNCLN